MFAVGRDKRGLDYSRLCGTPVVGFMNDIKGQRASLAGAAKMKCKGKISCSTCNHWGDICGCMLVRWEFVLKKKLARAIYSIPERRVKKQGFIFSQF